MERQVSPKKGKRFSTTALLLPLLVLGVWPLGCSPARSKAVARTPLPPKPTNVQVGVASYYAHKYQGRTTANGEVFDMNKLTAAHRTLPFGTILRVTHLGNDHSVVVRVNDRGPYVTGRIIDLSLAAASELGMIQSGLAQVRVEVLEQRQASR